MADSPRLRLHRLAQQHTGTADDHLLEDWQAWSAAREAASEGLRFACPELGGDSR